MAEISVIVPVYKVEKIFGTLCRESYFADV